MEGFAGWYFKCQSEDRTLAVIPAIHGDTCSIQLLTDCGAWCAEYPAGAYEKNKSGIRIEGCRFGTEGITLNIAVPGLTARGSLAFGPMTPLRYDIMGPFRYVPFMQCRHSVMSMYHTVTGTLTLDGETYAFDHASGYWEGDRGRSFPRQYAWMQCFLPEGSMMLSVADIPMGIFRFTGVIGAIFWEGREYRLATYLGAKAVRIRGGEIIVRQGGSCLRVKQLEQAGRPLRAPRAGTMARTIHEHAACRVLCSFRENEHTVFSLEVPNASFEYEYPG